MPTKVLAALLLVGLAACGSGQPDKIEETLGPSYTCADNRIDPGYRPPAGCTCKATWSHAGVTICDGRCGNPDGDPGGPWCYTTSTCAGRTWSYCSIGP
jgi:hypothetical protein